MRRRRSKTHPAARSPRPRRRVEGSADPFATHEKPPEPARCPGCGAVVRSGRWVWGVAAPGAATVECPACRRVAQDFPDGVVTLAGAFLHGHEAEIRALVAHVEENEKAKHPLSRGFPIEAGDGVLVVKTTDRRLAESIGRAVERAYAGRLERAEGDRSSPLRLHWSRD